MVRIVILLLLIVIMVIPAFITYLLLKQKADREIKKARNKLIAEVNQEFARLEQELDFVNWKLKAAKQGEDIARSDYYKLLEFVMKRKIKKPPGSNGPN